MQNVFHLTEGNVAFHHALLKFSPCRHKMLPQLARMADWYSIHALIAAAKLGCRPTDLIFVEPGAKINGQYYRDMLLMQRLLRRSAACWRRVCLPARQCASTLCSWHNWVSAPWDTAVHQSWPQPGKLLHMGHAARARISSTNPRYGQVAEASCCNMGWIAAEHAGRCSWSLAKKTGSMYPCRRWSLSTLAVTLPAWHSNCHTSQPVLFRATNANPRPALSRATNVLRNATLYTFRQIKKV